MNVLRRSFVAALLALLPAAAACQSGSATVHVIDRTLLAVTVIPSEYTGEVGDTLTFRALVVDTVSGDTIDAAIEWRTSDPEGVAIDPETGHATLLRAGTHTVFADVASFTELVLMQLLEDGSVRDLRGQTLELQVGESAQLCAYLVTDRRVWMRSLELCPSRVLGNLEELPVRPFRQVRQAASRFG